MNKYKIITENGIVELNLDEKSLDLIVKLLKSLNDKVEIYKFNNNEFQLIETIIK